MTASVAQDRFAGVVKIVRFNVRFYAGSALGVLAAGALLALRPLPRWLEAAVWSGAALMAFWTLSSLVVSWYVYDHAGVTRWAWIPEQLPIAPRRWVNIHAGLDESSFALRQMISGSEGVVVDIYDAAEMTEPSIARARRLYPAAPPFLSGRSDALPLPNKARDTVLLLFAAHEVRDRARRTQLLRETKRVLEDGGQVILVEHLRDWKNFVAFGPGFFHFHSGRDWRRSIREAGLRVDREIAVTPFVSCFVLGKAEA